MTQNHKHKHNQEKIDSKTTVASDGSTQQTSSKYDLGGLNLFKTLFFKSKRNNNETLREAIEDIIEELDENEDASSAVATHEKSIISNVLKLRDTTVTDVMIPRADIAAIEVGADKDALMELLAQHQFSRIPVYKETLDDVLGSVHIKDILSMMASNMALEIKSMLRPVPVVSPSMPVLDLILQMQSDKKHMVFVVDEYGGIDGLVTIGDVIEAIVGEFDDEFDTEDDPVIIENADGSLTADARYDIDRFEEKYGKIFSDEEREEADTLGGLVFFTASRVPARGEVIKHNSGIVFEVIDADQRKIGRLRIKHIL
jgi:CBS domain containing-hemolysin-like protein